MRVEIWTRSYKKRIFVKDMVFVPLVGWHISFTGDDAAGTVKEVTLIACSDVVRVMSDMIDEDNEFKEV